MGLGFILGALALSQLGQVTGINKVTGKDTVQRADSGTKKKSSGEDDPDIYTGKRKPSGFDSKGTSGSMPNRGIGLTPRKQGAKITRKKSSYMNGIYKWTSAQIKDLQKKLLRGGFYPSGADESVITGIPDETTLQAYEVALDRTALYNQAGVDKTVTDVVMEGINANEQLGLNGNAGSPKVYMSPDEVRAQVAQQVGEIGGSAAGGVVEGITSQILAMDRQDVDRQAANEGKAGASRVAMAEPATIARKELFKRAPQKVAEFQYVERMNEAMELFGGGNL